MYKTVFMRLQSFLFFFSLSLDDSQELTIILMDGEGNFLIENCSQLSIFYQPFSSIGFLTSKSDAYRLMGYLP